MAIVHPPVIAEPQPFYDYGVAKEDSPQRAMVRRKRLCRGTSKGEKKVPVEKIVVKEVTRVVEVLKSLKSDQVEKFIFPPSPSASIRLNFRSWKGQVYLAAQRLKQKTDIAVVIEGYTDNVGPDEYNQKLGMRRAQVVMNELSALGIDRNRISAASFGENKPVLNQETAWARAVNRRVEFRLKHNK